MSRRFDLYPRTQVFLVMVVLLIIGLLFGIAARADVNLPPTCPVASAEGQAISSCPSSQQRFERATVDTLVRSCVGFGCLFADARWKRFGDVSNTDSVEVCTVDKPVGEVVGGGSCSDGSSTWGAMELVQKSAVAAIEPVESEPVELSGTFDVTPVSGLSPLDVTITWDVPEADECTASGSWSGTKLASGSEVVTLSADASFTLSCTGAIGGVESSSQARLSWTAPTRNMDGSPLTDLAGYRVFYGASPSVLVQTVQIDNPGASAYTVDNLTPGTWYFGVKAFNESGVESPLSNVASRVIGESVPPAVGSFTATRTVDVSTQPQAPVLTVLEPIAGITQVPVFGLTASGNRSSAIAGFVSAGTACVGERVFGYRGFDYHLVPREAVMWWATEPKDVAAPCFDTR